MNERVDIQNKDFWVKLVGALQQNWAVIEPDGGGVRIRFMTDASGVFDEIALASQPDAIDALRRNGFRHFADAPDLHAFLRAPEPPFSRIVHVNGPIYSSGRFFSGGEASPHPAAPAAARDASGEPGAAAPAPRPIVQHSELITQSLELVGARSEDPTPAVYDLLFSRHPELKRLFWRDTDCSIRGNMLSVTIETLLDFAGTHHYSDGMLRCEIVNHENLGVAPQVFASFFPTMRDAFKEIAGSDWTSEMDAAWSALLAQMDKVMQAASPSLVVAEG
jgi:hemoglobin-like flavoprotein